ncbi:MAG: hypothetical protein ACE5NC_10980 [Anaerolineae bacterium]
MLKQTQFRIIASALGVGLLALGCAPAPRGETQAQLDAARDLSESVADLQAQIEDTGGEITGLEGRITDAEETIAGFTGAVGAHALDHTAGIPEPPSGKVALRLSFQYMPAALPGDGILVYEPTPEVSSLWAMESLAAGQEMPVGAAIDSRTLFMDPGESRTVTLAYQNPAADDVGFLVLPHQESPGSLGAYVWPTCLCMSFVYEAPAGGSWYRVINITVSPDIPAGSQVDSLWSVLTDSSVFPTD